MSKWTGLLCFYCGCRTVKGRGKGTLAKNTLTRDHVIPVMRGIGKAAAKTVPACLKCNHDKGTLSLEEYRLVLMFRAGMIWMSAKALFHGEKIKSL